MFIQLPGFHPGFEYRRLIIRVDLEDAGHPFGGYHDAPGGRDCTPGESAAPPPGGYRNTLFIRIAQKSGGILGGFDHHHRRGFAVQAGGAHHIPGVAFVVPGIRADYPAREKPFQVI